MLRSEFLRLLPGAVVLVGAGPHLAQAVAIHDNQLVFVDNTLAKTPMNFIWDGQYAITNGQPWAGVSVEGSNTSKLVVHVQAGRQNSDVPASWFNTRAPMQTISVSTLGGTSGPPGFKPAKLNFALSGTLVIGGKSYRVVLGQGSDGGNNNWWIGGPDFFWDDRVYSTTDRRATVLHLGLNGAEAFRFDVGLR